MTLRHVSRIARPLAAVVAVAALAGCSQSSLLDGKDGYPAQVGGEHGAAGGHSASATHSSVPTSASGPAVADPKDVTFLQQMVPHHEQAVKMSEMALSKQGVSANVKKLATAIKTAQTTEIATMKGLIGTSGATGMGMDHSGHGDMPGMMSDADMKALSNATGTAFDKKWLTMMIAHHEGAVTSASDVLKTTKNADVKKLAESMVTSQKAEISTMKKLLNG